METTRTKSPNTRELAPDETNMSVTVKKAFARAEVKNPGNILRHSFCSYHIALNRDAAATAVLLTHRSPAMLYQHYRGRATHADAEAFFALRP